MKKILQKERKKRCNALARVQYNIVVYSKTVDRDVGGGD